MPQPLITLEGIRKTLGGRRVLDGLSWELREGECAVILGPSGGGKSVFLQTLLGFLPPDAGRVTYPGLAPAGDATNDDADPFESIAVVFQDDALLDARSIEANLALAREERIAALHPPRGAETLAAIDAALREVGLNPARVRPALPAQLSGGMRRRAALARALLREPRVLIADEPTSGLDPASAARIFDLLENLIKTRGLSAVIVTHDPECASRLGRPVYYFSPVDGRMPRWPGAAEDASPEARLLDLETWMRGQIAEHARRTETADGEGVQLPGANGAASETIAPLPSLSEIASERAGEALAALGRAGLLLGNLARTPAPLLFLENFIAWGFASLPLTAMIFLLLGVISLIQTQTAVAEYGFANRIPELVALGLLRLAPILTGFLMAGRCGSAIAAQMGSMRLGRQFEALRTLRIEPDAALFPPLFWSLTLSAPLLALAGVALGGLGAALGMAAPGFDPGITASYFLADFPQHITLGEILGVVLKSLLMGGGLAAIAYSQGASPKRSPAELSRAITRTLVLAFIWATLADAALSLMLPG